MSGGKGGRSSTSVEIPAWLESAARQNIARADQIAQIGYTPYYGPDVAAMTPMQMAAGENINAAAGAFGLGAPTSITAGMPMAQNYGGMSAYSSAPIYEQSLAELQARRPGQYAALQAPFIDPVTGAPPAAPFSANLAFADQTMAPAVTPIIAPTPSGENTMVDIYTPSASDGVYNDSFASSRLRASLPGGVNDPFLESGFSQGVARAFDRPQSPPTAADRPMMRPDNLGSSSARGGYTGLRDMFDGGGPGQSGSTFQGGGAISNIGNVLGGPRSRNSDRDGSGSMGGGK